MKEKKVKRRNKANSYITKWLSILAVVIAVGGVFAFGFVAYLANFFGETADTYNPIWMVYMIPFMFLIATPVTVFIAKILKEHINVLTEAMSAVADGKTDVYIPTAGNEAFAGIYENFNKMTAEIQGIQALRIQLADSFSHELKTPVASINGFAKMLYEEDLTEEKRKKYLGIIIKESDRLASLAKNNLLLSKVDAQEIITDKEVFSLNKQIQQIAIVAENEWSEKNITLSADLAEVEYNGSADLIACVWQNLLSNAIKFTPKNGEINITLRKESGEITVTVADTGIGMSDDVKERIFERYFQGDSSHSGKGHGLGLSIVKRIVTLCNGRVEVESKENEGSTFTVTLPQSNA